MLTYCEALTGVGRRHLGRRGRGRRRHPAGAASGRPRGWRSEGLDQLRACPPVLRHRHSRRRRGRRRGRWSDGGRRGRGVRRAFAAASAARTWLRPASSRPPRTSATAQGCRGAVATAPPVLPRLLRPGSRGETPAWGPRPGGEDPRWRRADPAHAPRDHVEVRPPKPKALTAPRLRHGALGPGAQAGVDRERDREPQSTFSLG